MCKILTKPLDEIKKFKKQKKIGKSFLYLLYTLIASVIVILIYNQRMPISLNPNFITIAIVVGIVLILFKALLSKIAVAILKGKATYFAGLTSEVFMAFIMSVGGLIAALLGYIPKLGLLLGAIVVSIFTVLAISVKLKAMMELFDIDILTAIVVCTIVFFTVFTVAYMSFVLWAMAARIAMITAPMMVY